MKIFIFTLMLLNITLQPIENYLGKSIREFHGKIPMEKEAEPRFDGLTDYRVNTELHRVFFTEKECLRLSFRSKEQEKIHSVYLSIKMVDKQVFQSLVEKYGNPTSMQKMGAIKETKEFKNEVFTTKSKAGNAVDCSFEENPLFIVWEKKTYTIRISMDYGRKISSILFELKE